MVGKTISHYKVLEKIGQTSVAIPTRWPMGLDKMMKCAA